MASEQDQELGFIGEQLWGRIPKSAQRVLRNLTEDLPFPDEDFSL